MFLTSSPPQLCGYHVWVSASLFISFECSLLIILQFATSLTLCFYNIRCRLVREFPKLVTTNGYTFRGFSVGFTSCCTGVLLLYFFILEHHWMVFFTVHLSFNCPDLNSSVSKELHLPSINSLGFYIYFCERQPYRSSITLSVHNWAPNICIWPAHLIIIQSFGFGIADVEVWMSVPDMEVPRVSSAHQSASGRYHGNLADEPQTQDQPHTISISSKSALWWSHAFISHGNAPRRSSLQYPNLRYWLRKMPVWPMGRRSSTAAWWLTKLFFGFTFPGEVSFFISSYAKYR